MHKYPKDDIFNHLCCDMKVICDIGGHSFKKTPMDNTLQSDMKKSLFSECKIFKRLSVILRLFNLKVKDVWTDRNFTELL